MAVLDNCFLRQIGSGILHWNYAAQAHVGTIAAIARSNHSGVWSQEKKMKKKNGTIPHAYIVPLRQLISMCISKLVYYPIKRYGPHHQWTMAASPGWRVGTIWWQFVNRQHVGQWPILSWTHYLGWYLPPKLWFHAKLTKTFPHQACTHTEKKVTL